MIYSRPLAYALSLALVFVPASALSAPAAKKLKCKYDQDTTDLVTGQTHRLLKNRIAHGWHILLELNGSKATIGVTTGQLGISDRAYDPGRVLALKFADDSVVALKSTNSAEPTHTADKYYTYSWYLFEFEATETILRQMEAQPLVLFQSSLLESQMAVEGKPDRKEQKATMNNAACFLRDWQQANGK